MSIAIVSRAAMERVLNDSDNRLMDHVSASKSNINLPNMLRWEDVGASATIPATNSSDSQRLIKVHERIINDVSLIQRRWIQKRSRVETVSTTIKEKEQQFQIVTQLPASTIRQNKLDLLKRLHELRKHRIALTAKIKVARRLGKNSKKSILYRHLQKQLKTKLHGDIESNVAVTGTSVQTNGDQQNERLMYDLDYQRQVWHQIRDMRQMKCIQAAYRLTGVSMTMVPNDDSEHHELTRIRFDIGADHSYDCDFDMVQYKVEDEDDDNDDQHSSPGTSSTKAAQIFFHLVRHTLPSAIPTATIFQKAIRDCSYQATTGNSTAACDDSKITALMIPIGYSTSSILLGQQQHTNDTSNCGEQQSFMKQLQFITQQIYHSCHAYHMRCDIYEHLQRLVAKSGGADYDSTLPYSIQQLQRTFVPQQTLIYKAIEFHILHQLSSIDHIQVTLHYTSDLCRLKAHQPTSVQVKIISPSNHVDDVLYNNSNSIGDSKKHSSPWSTSSLLQNLEGTVSDVEDERNDIDDGHDQNQYEFIESAIRSFRTLPMKIAIQTVTDAMTEY